MAEAKWYVVHTYSGYENKVIEKSLDRTAVWRISIDSLTGKRKKYDKSGEEMKFGRTE